ncbi:melanoma-associated antigen B4-like [Dugong dugon]
MPRGQKSKLRSREKRRQARGESKGLEGAQASAAAESSSPSPDREGTPQSAPAAGKPPASQTAPRPRGRAAARAAGRSRPRANGGAQSQAAEGPGASQASSPSESSCKDPLNRKASTLVQFLLRRYHMREPVAKVEMLRLVGRENREHFSEILRRTTERMELLFGLDLKPVGSRAQSYALVRKPDLPKEGALRGGREFPKYRLLMPLLGVIFVNGSRAFEEEIWQYLNMLGVYDGRRHYIFGEPRKLITKDLVQEKYLEYRLVPNSDPPRCEFLWGPRAHAESSKMKVLKFWAKVNGIAPRAFPSLYEEALREEQEKIKSRLVTKAGPTAVTKARARARAKSGALPTRREV